MPLGDTLKGSSEAMTGRLGSKMPKKPGIKGGEGIRFDYPGVKGKWKKGPGGESRGA